MENSINKQTNAMSNLHKGLYASLTYIFKYLSEKNIVEKELKRVIKLILRATYFFRKSYGFRNNETKATCKQQQCGGVFCTVRADG
jgi:hypothetical protein